MDLELVAREVARRGHIKEDAGETIAFARSLEHVMTEVQTAENITLRARELFPVSPEVPAVMESYTNRQVARVGKAKLGGSNMKVNDMPTAELYGKEYNAPVRTIYMAYEYSIDEFARSAYTKINVDTEKGLAVRRAMSELEESVAFSGDSDHGLVGILGATGVAATSKVGVTWDNAAITPEIILNDIHNMFAYTFTSTRGLHVADTLAVGTAAYGILARTYQSATFKDTTLIDFILKSSPWCKAIVHTPYLDDLGTSAKELQLVYKRDPAVVKMVVPMDFQQFAPELSGTSVRVGCRQKTGGIMVRHPKAVTFMQGTINAAGLTGGSTLG